MVYVYEKQRWESKVVVKNAIDEKLLSEQELNALGATGWGLVGVFALPGKTQFYFKRVKPSSRPRNGHPSLAGWQRLHGINVYSYESEWSLLR